ncbi:multiple antibiotic resistance protein [Escherichia coli]|nr:multiple antibiotic resistance protein [Escherichia coli]
MLDLFKAIGLGLVVLLPLANPLTTVALFLGLAGNMNSAERNRQSLMASVYVFAIMMVAYYAGQLVMDTFGISIPRSANCRRLNRRVYRFSDALSATESD